MQQRRQQPSRSERRPTRLFASLIVLTTVVTIARGESHRRIAVGDSVPAFTAKDARGQRFEYGPENARPLLLAFLSSTQSRSAQAWKDLDRILSDVPAEDARAIQAAAVFSDPNDGLFSQASQHADTRPIRVIADRDYRIWGMFGVIATPTVIIADARGKVLAVKAGYSYDFEPVLKAFVEQSLGLRGQVDVGEAGRVKALENTSQSARARRHERMAEILESKGRHELAAIELRKAAQIDPNSVSTAVRLGEMLCLAGDPNEAISSVRAWGDNTSLPARERAGVLRIFGWAYRQKGRLAEARQMLEASKAIVPASPRTLFELAETAREQNEPDFALALYREAARLLLEDPKSISQH